jgi:hypothetical protein
LPCANAVAGRSFTVGMKFLEMIPRRPCRWANSTAAVGTPISRPISEAIFSDQSSPTGPLSFVLIGLWIHQEPSGAESHFGSWEPVVSSISNGHDVTSCMRYVWGTWPDGFAVTARCGY